MLFRFAPSLSRAWHSVPGDLMVRSNERSRGVVYGAEARAARSEAMEPPRASHDP